MGFLINSKPVLFLICFVIVSPIMFAPANVRAAASISGTWTQTSKADWDSNTLSNLDTSTLPGDVILASGGAIAHMGADAINSTWNLGACSCTVVDDTPGLASPVTGYVERVRFYDVSGGGTFQLRVFRDNGTHFLFVGQSQAVSTTAGPNAFDLFTPILVRRGDLIGYKVGGTTNTRVEHGGFSYFIFQDITTATLKSGWSVASFYNSVQADILPIVNGTLVSTVRDTGGSSTWGSISWHANVTAGDSIAFSTRTSIDNSIWSPWLTNSSGGAIASPAGRFIQYRGVFTANGTLTPVLHDVTISYSTTPSSSSIFLSVSPGSLATGGTITVNGMLSPGISASIGLTYTRPDGSTVNRTVTSNSVGFFSDNYAPDAGGTWKVIASWSGQSLVTGAQSTSQTFTVESSSFLSTFLPWLILILVVAGFGVAVLLTKPKTPKMG